MMGPELVRSEEGMDMKKITITVDDYLYNFYSRVGKAAGGLPPEKVMADALFKLAGELSLNAIHKKERTNDTEHQH